MAVVVFTRLAQVPPCYTAPVRYKGKKTPRQIEAEFPHFVEVEIPGSGLGKRLGAIYAWCDGQAGRSNYAFTQRHEREAVRDFLQVRFRDEETAAAFRREFGPDAA